MRIDITQDEQGRDVVTINGAAVSPAIAVIILNAVEEVERIQEYEATSHFDKE